MDISSDFKMIFIAVLAITILCLIGIGSLAIFGSQSTESSNISIAQQNLSFACSFGWQSGVGALFGLIGGKTASKS